MEENQAKIDVLTAEALSLYYRGEFTEAERKYREILQLNSNHAEAWWGLGIVYYMLGEYQDALEMLYRSLDFDSASPNSHYSLGLVLEKIGYLPQAVQAYKKAIALAPHWIEVYDNLGKVLSEMGEIEQAEATYIQAIATDKKNYINYLNLGNILMMRQQIKEAIAAYEMALQLKPRDPIILNNLGLAWQAQNEPVQASLYFGYAAYRQGDYQAAITHYKNFLANQIGDVEVYIALAECYQYLDLYEEVIKTYRECLIFYPQVEIYLRLALTLQDSGQTEAAIDIINEALEIFPDEISLQLEQLRILPIIYENQEEIRYYRHRFSQGLADLIQRTSLETPEAKESALRAIGWRTNFYLQYQGCNDLELQKQYGQFVHRVMAANHPEWVKKVPMPNVDREEKIRIGYVSDCFHFHTVGMVFLGWLKNCDREKFHISCYYTNNQIDEYTQQYQISCDNFYHIPDNLEAICQQIIGDRIHILVFLDIGMVPQMTQLAALRLAPIQCAAWGHPVTTGLPTIDYFLSGDFMEPENAQQHYSEQLIRLPNIGISYSKPIIPAPTKTRFDFNLKENAVIYISCQSLFKYLPQYDYIFPSIAQQVPQAQFVFLSQLPAPINQQFRQRLHRAFAEFGLDSEQYCIILPRQTHIDYWHLNLVSDVFLDTFRFTGFLTTLESIACRLPIVTCPGEFMRSRQSYGILKMLGISETIAQNEAEYIEIAVKLGLQPEWRHSIVKRIGNYQEFLYEDKACIEALEAFFEQEIGGWRSLEVR
ncbi:MAG TPA: tetratricopeptide repeat protein [Leptolyngbyaceae cyanobacterium]